MYIYLKHTTFETQYSVSITSMSPCHAIAIAIIGWVERKMSHNTDIQLPSCIIWARSIGIRMSNKALLGLGGDFHTDLYTHGTTFVVFHCVLICIDLHIDIQLTFLPS